MNSRKAVRFASIGLSVLLLGGLLSSCANDDAGKKHLEKAEDSKKVSMIKPSEVEKASAKALEEAVGKQPTDIQCGEADIPMQIGTKVLCNVIDGNKSLEAEVTINQIVSNTDFGVTVKVAEDKGAKG